MTMTADTNGISMPHLRGMARAIRDNLAEHFAAELDELRAEMESRMQEQFDALRRELAGQLTEVRRILRTFPAAINVNVPKEAIAVQLPKRKVVKTPVYDEASGRISALIEQEVDESKL